MEGEKNEAKEIKCTERERERDFTSHICETPMTPLQFEKEQISVACTIVSSRGRNVRNG